MTSVSGGSYIAGALAILNRGPFEVEEDDEQSRARPAIMPEEGLPAFDPGSPEEHYLRDRTRYLTHGWGGPLGAMWRLLCSIVLNGIVLGLALMVVAVPLGWLYGWAVPSFRDSCPTRSAPHSFGFPEGYYLAAIAFAGLGVILGLAWVGRSWRREERVRCSCPSLSGSSRPALCGCSSSRRCR